MEQEQFANADEKFSKGTGEELLLSKFAGGVFSMTMGKAGPLLSLSSVLNLLFPSDGSCILF